MSFSIQLPASCTCIMCFTENYFEKRTSKNGLLYYKCSLCSQRLWLYSRVHQFALVYWAGILSDPAVSRLARETLERGIREAGQPLHVPARLVSDVTASATIPVQ